MKSLIDFGKNKLNSTNLVRKMQIKQIITIFVMKYSIKYIVRLNNL